MKLASLTRSLFARKSAGRPAPVRGVRLQLEGLADRVAPAVLASVVNGVLIVKPETPTDANPDSLSVTPVAGFAGRFTLTAVNATFVNGTPFGSFDAVGVTSMKIDLGDGDDTLDASDLVLAGGISFRGGNGANTFHLQNSFIGGSVSVANRTNATGTDTTSILNSTVNGSVTVNGGLGNTFSQLDRLNILGSLRYATVSSALIPGNDSVLGLGLTVGGSITLTLANGENQFTGSVTPVEAGGTFTYTGGVNKDKVDFLGGANIGASASISLGEGQNVMTAQSARGVFVGANLTVTAGAGDDYLELSTTDATRANRATFNLGNGDNTFKASSLRAGTLSLTTGRDDDTGTIDNLTVVGAATMNFGAGTNTVKLASDSASTRASSVGGALTVTTGAGADTVQVGANIAVRVGGAAKFTLGTTAAGNSDNSLQINSALFASSLGIFGGSGNDTMLLGNLLSVGIAGRLTVTANAGNDRLDLGVAGDVNKVVRLLVVPALNGGAGSDFVGIFAGGRVQEPPVVPPKTSVLPTGPALLAAGWEGIG